MVFHLGRSSGRALVLQNSAREFRCLSEYEKRINESQVMSTSGDWTCEENDENIVTILPG